MNGTNEAIINLVTHAPGTNPVTLNIIVSNVTNSISQVATNAVVQTSTNPHPVWTRVLHIAIIVVLALVANMIVRLVRNLSERIITRSHEKKYRFDFVTQQPKFVTLTRLIVSTLNFVIYALMVYVILVVEFPTVTDSAFKTYLTSAAVIGLALSFGLQGLVQDVVTGITIILSDAMDVGDTVDLMNGVIGRVERIGLRFTKVTNFFNQEIFVPNRNIVNVSRFPHGGIFAYADIQIPLKCDQNAVVEAIQNVSKGIQAQFNAIILTEPIFSKVQTTPGNWNYLRVQFSIWPGQNAIMDTTFRMQMVNAMKVLDPTYSDWQVVVTYRAIR